MTAAVAVLALRSVLFATWIGISIWIVVSWVYMFRGDLRPHNAWRRYGMTLVRVILWPTLAMDWFDHDKTNIALDLLLFYLYYRNSGGGGGGWRRKVKKLREKLADRAQLAPAPSL